MRIRDWSADVCYADLFRVTAEHVKLLEISSDVDSDEEGRLLHCSLWVLTKGCKYAKACGKTMVLEVTTTSGKATTVMVDPAFSSHLDVRSEERRVGNEWFSRGKSRWSPFNTTI